MKQASIALVTVLLFACTPSQVSRAKQTADLICAEVAVNFHLLKGDPLSERLAIACLDRLERNEAIEDALRAGVAGAPPAPVAGAAGAAEAAQ